MTETPTSPSEDGLHERAVQFSIGWGACGNYSIMLAAFARKEIAALTRPAPSSPALDPVTVEKK